MATAPMVVVVLYGLIIVLDVRSVVYKMVNANIMASFDKEYGN